MRMMKRQPDPNPQLQVPPAPSHVVVPKACCHMYQRCGEHGVSQAVHQEKMIDPLREKMPKARPIPPPLVD